LYYFVGKSSANIITLSLIKKQLNVFFAKKLKKYHFAIHLYLYIIVFWLLRPVIHLWAGDSCPKAESDHKKKNLARA